MKENEQIKSLLLRHCERYPEMLVQDAVKILYQSEFAGGHIIENEYESLKCLKAELTLLEAELQYHNDEVFEDIGGGLCRLNLRRMKEIGIELETLNRFFVKTAKSQSGTIKAFEQKLDVLKQLCLANALPFGYEEAEAYISALKERGYTHLCHSDEYREAYHPAYRVVKTMYRDYIDVFRGIDALLSTKDKVNVAIDGNCGAGKSVLALLISGIYDCNLFHMDDFFLRPLQRNPQRLSEPGGNVDRERFFEEVISGLKGVKTFDYRRYDCKTQTLGQPVTVSQKRLNIIEGTYSLHPGLSDFYDLKVFMQVGANEQSARILSRSGAGMYVKFLTEWIPMENIYFETFKIKEKCDIIFGSN